jgi:aspartyl protease family protein
LLAVPADAQVESIRVVALFADKAMLSIDGANVVLAEGEVSTHGVKLIEADQFHAVIEYQGSREELTLSTGNILLAPGVSGEVAEPRQQSLLLYADQNGMFHTTGRINGSSVRFVVDTGATSIAISSVTARQIGLNYSDGERGFAQTASGLAPTWVVTLDRVQVGSITLRYVEAAVVEGAFPVQPLLGMSFLGMLDMQRSGNQMELRSR